MSDSRERFEIWARNLMADHEPEHEIPELIQAYLEQEFIGRAGMLRHKEEFAGCEQSLTMKLTAATLIVALFSTLAIQSFAAVRAATATESKQPSLSSPEVQLQNPPPPLLDRFDRPGSLLRVQLKP